MELDRHKLPQRLLLVMVFIFYFKNLLSICSILYTYILGSEGSSGNPTDRKHLMDIREDIKTLQNTMMTVIETLQVFQVITFEISLL